MRCKNAYCCELKACGCCLMTACPHCPFCGEHVLTEDACGRYDLNGAKMHVSWRRSRNA